MNEDGALAAEPSKYFDISLLPFEKLLLINRFQTI